MSRALSNGLQLAKSAHRAGLLPGSFAAANQQIRWGGGGGVPEYWGKPSAYTEGTDFLGTPPDHLKKVATRPVSPHVFEIDGKGFHYKMPINAISSIMTRVTGVALTAGAGGAGFVALTGDLPAAVEALKASYPLLVIPIKGAIVFPLIYHYLAGVRHVVWDKHRIGKNSDHKSLLENETVDKTSRAIIATSLVGTAALALYSV
ncbi:hypothetical protein WJX72_010894 [[Myrmecia] bisecta]|uniref:Uncharacterized protein n=1 Tax=[Myrmecia] bisecta TaxID=41462 RepID=A0AAW1PPQ5_9CHLO